MENILIIGAGGFGREVEWLINRINNSNNNQWNLIGYVDDNVQKGTAITKLKVVYNTDELLKLEEKTNVVIAIGNAKVRKLIYNKIKENKNLSFPNLVDPSAIIGEVDMGIGNIICAGTIATVNIKINNFNIINLDCTIGHDDVLTDFITVYPSVNISGNTTINEVVEIGTGTQIIQGKNICSNVIIGAGAVVVKDIEEEGTYIGIPVKKIVK